MSRAAHLTRRFFGALRPGGPSPADDRWAAQVLTGPEYALWAKMPDHDRRHSIAVARRVDATLAGTDQAGDDQWLAAALLHDVGKLDAGLGVFARVGATIAGTVAGRDDARRWSAGRGVRRRVGLYLRHDELGATRIRTVGGRETAARWAGAHHQPDPTAASGLPAPVADALRDADDD